MRARVRRDERTDEDTDRQRLGPDRRSAVSAARQADGPQWEEPRRFEAYPTIKSRTEMRGLPRLGVMAAAIAIAALALFFLPAVLGWFGDDDGGGGTGVATPNPSAASPEPSASPPPPAAPTPQVYIVRSGDTMSKIASRFGISLDDLLDANKDTITNPDLIAVGDPVIIPVPESDSLEGGGSPAP